MASLIQHYFCVRKIFFFLLAPLIDVNFKIDKCVLNKM
jgi:hypothetical protein